MKAERRHQLQENSLVHVIEAAPFFFRKYGTQLLLGLLIVVLVVVLIRNRAENATLVQDEARKSLTGARSAIEQIPHMVPMGATADPKDALDRVAKTREAIEQQLNVVFEQADDPAILAEARLARGDLNWELANYPRFAEATTRPTLKLDKTPEQFLDAAGKDYQNVLGDAKAPQISRTTARFNLAAIAESRRNWDDAKSNYQSVVDDPNADLSFKAMARQRLAMLDAMKTDQYVTEPGPSAADIFAPQPNGAATTQSTQSSTAPMATGPASAPATAPTSPAPATSGPPAPAPPNVPVEKQ
jgi:hypothetical protein